MKALLGLSALLVLFTSCGYRVGGKADLVPKGVQTIAIPTFTCLTTDYTVGDVLANSIGHEFTERTRFQVVKDPKVADAVLTGNVSRVLRSPSLSDPTTGKITTVQLIVVLSLKLVQRSDNKVLFSRPGLTLRETYEIAQDPHQIFDESGPALDRLSRNLARDIVTSIVEDF